MPSGFLEGTMQNIQTNSQAPLQNKKGNQFWREIVFEASLMRLSSG